MKFSITSPITMNRDDPDNLRMPRYEMFLRCATSVFNQTFTDWEWIIADDMCNPSVSEIISDLEIKYPFIKGKVKVVKLPEKSGRIIARNAAMKEATGDWICWLDGDDEYASTYLDMLNEAITIYPDFKVFNFNHLIFGYDYKPYIREFIDMEKQGDEPFGSGHIGAGAFVFNRSVYEDVGSLPELGMWDLATWAFENYPEIKHFFEKKDADGKPTGEYNSLGNPWGDDALYFYMITRKYKVKKLEAAPYYVHSRWGHRLPDNPDFVIDPGAKPEWNKNNL